MKKWQVILGTAMALLLSASIPLSALAQQDNNATAVGRPPVRASLAIVAPRIVLTSEEMSLGVFQRENQAPVPGVGVWALTRENADTLRQDSILKDKLINGEDADAEALLHDYGTFLGRTRGDGRLFHTFTNAGNYVLVAAKHGYVPDLSPLIVREPPADVLVVKAPRISPPGESVTITVTEKSNGEPVKDAGVWALTREDAAALRSRSAGGESPDNTDITGTLDTQGIFLGTTHGNGELKYTFEQEGYYVLVAFKEGYRPGFTGIAIKSIPQVLAIQAPRITPVGESVTMSVTLRGTEDPVKDAGVWALTPTEAEALRVRLAGSITPDTDIKAAVNGYGIFIGETNGNGEVKYRFDTAGRYILVAVKNSYIPGYTGIAIVNTTPAPNVTDRPDPSVRDNHQPPGIGNISGNSI